MAVEKVFRCSYNDDAGDVTFEENVRGSLTISVSNRKPFEVSISDLKEILANFTNEG